jgi:hypothetical protein
MWKFLIILIVFLEFSILGFWIYSGAEMLTKTKVPVTTTKKDELFGTEIQETVLKDKFILGLDYTGPAVVVLGSIGVISIIFYRREQKNKK